MGSTPQNAEDMIAALKASIEQTRRRPMTREDYFDAIRREGMAWSVGQSTIIAWTADEEEAFGCALSRAKVSRLAHRRVTAACRKAWENGVAIERIGRHLPARWHVPWAVSP